MSSDLTEDDDLVLALGQGHLLLGKHLDLVPHHVDSSETWNGTFHKLATSRCSQIYQENATKPSLFYPGLRIQIRILGFL